MQVLLLGLVHPRPPLLRRNGCAAGSVAVTVTSTANSCYNFLLLLLLFRVSLRVHTRVPNAVVARAANSLRKLPRRVVSRKIGLGLTGASWAHMRGQPSR